MSLFIPVFSILPMGYSEGGGIGALRDEYEKENLLLISQLMKEAGKLLSWKNKTKKSKNSQQVYTYCVPGSVFHVNLTPTLQHEDNRPKKKKAGLEMGMALPRPHSELSQLCS